MSQEQNPHPKRKIKPAQKIERPGGEATATTRKQSDAAEGGIAWGSKPPTPEKLSLFQETKYQAFFCFWLGIFLILMKNEALKCL